MNGYVSTYDVGSIPTHTTNNLSLHLKQLTMNIYQIQELTRKTAPYFFSKDSMKFFGQTMSRFRIKKQTDGRFLISQPMKDRNGKVMGYTERYFNPINNELELS